MHRDESGIRLAGQRLVVARPGDVQAPRGERRSDRRQPTVRAAMTGAS